MNAAYIKIVTTAIRLATLGHNDSNHKYGDASYTVHLSHVVDVCHRFIHLIPMHLRAIVIAACWLHDSIEDARLSFNDVKKAFQSLSGSQDKIKVTVNNEVKSFSVGEFVAELVRAVTNYTRGRNRDERMPDFIYKEINDLEFATFVKLCDRIANIEAGGKADMYKKEHPHFVDMLYRDKYKEMFDYIDDLFKQAA